MFFLYEIVCLSLLWGMYSFSISVFFVTPIELNLDEIKFFAAGLNAII